MADATGRYFTILSTSLYLSEHYLLSQTMHTASMGYPRARHLDQETFVNNSNVKQIHVNTEAVYICTEAVDKYTKAVDKFTERPTDVQRRSTNAHKR